MAKLVKIDDKFYIEKGWLSKRYLHRSNAENFWDYWWSDAIPEIVKKHAGFDTEEEAREKWEYYKKRKNVSSWNRRFISKLN